MFFFGFRKSIFDRSIIGSCRGEIFYSDRICRVDESKIIEKKDTKFQTKKKKFQKIEELQKSRVQKNVKTEKSGKPQTYRKPELKNCVSERIPEH